MRKFCERIELALPDMFAENCFNETVDKVRHYLRDTFRQSCSSEAECQCATHSLQVGHRVPDKDRAQSLIDLGYEQRPSDLADDVFLKKLVKRVKQWFVSYSAKSKKRTSNSYIASATEVVHQLMPTDIIESTVAAKGDAPSGQERDAANASTDLDVATATRCPKKSKPRMPKPKVMPTIAEPIAKPASTSTSSRPYRTKFPNSRLGGSLCHSGKRNLK